MPSPGDLSHSGIELASSDWQVGSSLLLPPGKTKLSLDGLDLQEDCQHCCNDLWLCSVTEPRQALLINFTVEDKTDEIILCAGPSVNMRSITLFCLAKRCPRKTLRKVHGAVWLNFWKTFGDPQFKVSEIHESETCEHSIVFQQ